MQHQKQEMAEMSLHGVKRLLRLFAKRLRLHMLPAWLTEHTYILARSAAFTSEALHAVKAVPFVSPEGEPSADSRARPYAFVVSEGIAPTADAEEMTEALQHFHPDEAFLRTFPALRAAYVLVRLERYLQNGGTGAPPALQQWMLLLHQVQTLNWQTVWNGVSAVERILRQDPAGIYPRSTRETRQAYRRAVQKLAKRQKTTELEAIKEQYTLAKQAVTPADQSLAAWLFPQKSHERRGAWLHIVLYLFSALLSVMTFLLLRPYSMGCAALSAVFLLLPFYALLRECADLLAARFAGNDPILSLSLDAVPDEGRTLTVITTRLSGETQDKNVFDNLERFYLRNRGENLYFGVLGDLPQAAHATTADDDAILSYAAARIDALNKKYGERFCLFIRARRYAVGEGMFMGWERKRGAVIELVRYLHGRETSFSLVMHGANPISPIRYICTLDADTELPPDALRTMLGAMLHPQNQPVVKHGRVVQGIGMLQPSMAVTLAGATRTRFTLLCTGKGGTDPYSRHHTDGEQTLYGEGSFCGKGIFSVDAFYETIDAAFPEEAVLSHDFLEGQRLGCRNFHEVTFQDSIPTGVLSYFERQSRWVRGDTQALAFCLPRVRDADGKKHKNPVSLAGRLRIVDHVLYALIPAAIVRCAVVGSFFGLPLRITVLLWLLSFSCRMLRPITLLFRGYAWRSLLRTFTGLVLTDMKQSLGFLWFRFCLAPYEAWVNLKAIGTALWRMCITKKHMLAWVTAGEAEQKKRQKSLLGVVLCMRMTILTGALLLFSPYMVTRIIGGLWIFSPLYAWYLGKPYGEIRRKRTEDDMVTTGYACTAEACAAYAADIWRYFANHVTPEESYLPPDNVQWFPYPEKQTAHRTSPTNIGLYLLACFAARQFGLITLDEVLQRLDHTLDTVESLETCRGHLYNWYDTTTGQRIGAPYLSAVDSGNFACCLITAAGAARAYIREDVRFAGLAHRLDTLASAMDFTIFYDTDKALLSIGYDAEHGTPSTGHYDFYCSEARSAVYFAVAMGQIPAAAWEALGRPVTVRDRRMGALSWTGSAFEYFMPALWLAVPPDSFSAEILAFAADQQANHATTVCTAEGCYPVFGKSEGAYFAFDGARSFQYQPCGIGALGLQAGLDEERLVMPYASFLMLPYAVENRIPIAKNLADLRALGMVGEYGYYEALDMTDARVGGGWAIVRSVMAHHLGMSIVALANTAFDGVFQKYFAADARMEAAEILLWEKIPADAHPAEMQNAIQAPQNLPRRQRAADPHAQTVDTGAPVWGILSNTYAYVAASSVGEFFIENGAAAVTVPLQHMDRSEALCALPPLFYLLHEGRSYSPCVWNAPENLAASFQFYCGDDRIVYTGAYVDGITAILTITLAPDCSSFGFLLSLKKEEEALPFALTMLFRPVLYPAGAYAAHPTFADLFLKTTIESAANTVTVCRRVRSSQEKPVVMTVSAAGLTDFGAQTALHAIVPMGYDRETLARLPRHAEEICRREAPSSAVVPAVFLHGECSGETQVFLTVAEKMEDILARAGTAPAKGLFASLRAEHRMLCGDIGSMDDTVSAMLEAVMHRGTRLYAGRASAVHGEGKAQLWKYGISGDLPLFAFSVHGKEEEIPALRKTLNAWKYLLISGVRADMVLAVAEMDDYTKPAGRLVTQCIRDCGLSFFLKSKKGGGLHFLSVDAAETDGILQRAVWTWGEKIGKKTEPKPIMLPQPPQKTVRYHMTDTRVTVYKGKQNVPWAHMLTNRVFGTLLTQDTLGFTFFSNARECRVTPWYPEALSLRCGERILCSTAGGTYDLCRSAETWIVEPERVCYMGQIGDIAYVLTVAIPDRRKQKCLTLRMQNHGKTPYPVKLRYEIEPLMGAVPEDGEVLLYAPIENGICVSAQSNAACGAYEILLTITDTASSDARDGTGGREEKRVYAAKDITLMPEMPVEAAAVLAVRRRGETAISHAAPVRRVPRRQVLSTGQPYFDALANTWLPVQIFHSRLWGRCGFWQPGGAYGFRDQLQDAMAAAYLDPDTLRVQLYRAAAHQYVEGDVQHWWHPLPLTDAAKFHRGIRSRCSDDYLWLPLACAYYIAGTGDERILDVEIRYIESAPLGSGEHERYEEPLRSAAKESLYMHCIRALEHAFRFGTHGLPLMGIGDWNDGMNAVGVHGRGESVWMGMFLLLVLARFLPVCEKRGDMAGAEKYRAVMKPLADAIEEHAWNGKWYRRAWYDDGSVMGDPGQKQAEIDLLPQAFAALLHEGIRLPGGAKPFDEEHVHAAINTAYQRLFDEKIGLFALLDPPFNREEGLPNPGYIAGYMPGIRENGGQYTHAAVWGAMALFAAGEQERGLRVLRALSPVWQTRDETALARYQKEPYALCGDVLRADGRCGEGGWSLYTGSAGWYYRLLLSVFGKDADLPDIPKWL